MARWVIRKCLCTCLSLLLVATLTFVLMKSIPGDPFQQEQTLPKEIYEGLLRHYGLNDPWLVQYGRYLKQLVTFNFGPSLVHKGRTINAIITDGFPISALLGLEALALAVPGGLLLGMVGGLKQRRWEDSLITLISIVGISMPSFILATLLQYVLGVQLALLPIALWGSLAQSILPALSLAALPMAFIARLTRAKLADELQQGYVTTARAKGLPESIVIVRHTLRNIITPVLSYLGPLTANILTGSFIVEKIFSIPGLGYWFVSSVLNRDYPLIMGITVFYCAILLFITLFVDLMCLLIDPRLAKGINI